MCDLCRTYYYYPQKDDLWMQISWDEVLEAFEGKMNLNYLLGLFEVWHHIDHDAQGTCRRIARGEALRSVPA